MGTASLPSAHHEHKWSIGMYFGSSPVALAPARRASNPIITAEDVTDVRAGFAADPFMIRVRGFWYLFFELWNSATAKGELAVATSDDGLNWQYQQVVLSEPFHISYPYVFEWAGELFMVPETRRAGEVRLYRARSFPTEWSLEHALLRGPDFADSSLFRCQDHWWLFTENSNLKHDTLRLFHADKLTGPWWEHPCSPIISGNPHIARPAGRVVVDEGGQVIRYAQDCDPFYGVAVRAFEITELTPSTYRERAIGSRPVLRASGRGWNRCGMHHVDPHRLENGRWLACVDGWYDQNDLDWLD